MASPRIRTLRTSSAGVARADERGTWLEILDGGAHGWETTLELRLRGEESAIPGADLVPCIGGTVIVADFDEIRMVAASGGEESVVIRTGFGPPPPQVTGKSRFRWLGQVGGSSTVAGSATSILLDMSADLRDDVTDYEAPAALELVGWISGSRAFTATVTSCADPANPAEVVLASGAATLMKPPAGTGLANQYTYLLQGLGGAHGLMAPNLYRVYFTDTSTATNVVNYILGMRG